MKKDIREKVWKKYGKRCAYCGKSLKYTDLQVDHLIAKRTGIAEHESNYMPSCRRCNHYKRAYSLKLFREMMETLHKRVADHYINKVAIDYGIIELKPFDGKFYFERIEQNE